MRSVWLRTVCALGVVWAWGCSEPDVAGGGGAQVDAGADPGRPVFVKVVPKVQPVALGIGEQATVSCVRVDTNGGAQAAAQFVVKVDNEQVLSVAGDSLTALSAGQSAVTCAVDPPLPSDQVVVTVTTSPLVSLSLTGPTEALEVGTAAALKCVALDGEGEQVVLDAGALQFEAPLEPIPGQSALTSKKAGTFAVRCGAGASQLLSNEVKLKFVPGKSVQVITTVSPTEIVAGQSGAKVSCAVLDQWDNVVVGAPTTIQVPEDLTLLIDTVTGKKAGVYPVRCQSEALAGAPQNLAVKAAPPDFSKALTSQKSAVAGEALTVQCEAFDAFGNAVAVAAGGWAVKGSNGCLTSGGSVTCKTAGAAQIRCEHPEIKEAVATSVEILPGPPVNFAVTLAPKQGNYQHGQVVSVVGLAKDAYGNVISDVAFAKLSVSPAGASSDTLNRQVSCLKDGLYTVTAAPKEAPKLSAKVEMLCDSTGPLINISLPTRGTTRYHSTTFKTKMSVVDELSAIKSMSFQSKALTQKGGVSLSLATPMVHGLNLLRVDAADQWDNASTHTQSFYAAKAYAKTQTKDGAQAMLPNGLEAWLGQPVIDSGKRAHKSPKDIATVLEVVLKDFDLKAATGQGFEVSKFGTKFLVTVKSIDFGSPLYNGGYPEATLTAKNGGLTLKATLRDLEAKVFAEGKNWISPDLDILVTTPKVTVSAEVALSLDAAGNAKVKTSDVKVTLDELKVKIENGWGWLVNWLIGLFNGTITSSIESAIEEQLATGLDGPLAQVLDAFALNLAFDVPGFLGAPKTPIKVASKLSALNFYGPSGGYKGGARLRTKLALTSVKKITSGAYGSLLRRSCLKSSQTLASLNKVKPMSVSLHLDSLNQFLAALWQHGAFEVAVDQSLFPDVDLKALGFTSLAGKVKLTLPPQLNDCLPDGKLRVQLGDVRVDLSLKNGSQTLVLTAYLSMSALGQLKVQAGGIGIGLGKFEVLETHVSAVTLDGKSTTQGTAAFFAQFAPGLAQLVAGQMSGALATVPLPEIDLSLMSQSIPKNTTLSLDLQQVTATPGHVMASGGVK